MNIYEIPLSDEQAMRIADAMDRAAGYALFEDVLSHNEVKEIIYACVDQSLKELQEVEK